MTQYDAEDRVTPMREAERIGKRARGKRGLVLVAIIGSIVLQFIPTWQLQSRNSRIMRDFADLYAGGVIVREGNGSRLYDPALQLQVERERTMRPDQIGFLPYVHAPYEALLFAALSLFSYATANWIWWVCNVVLFFSTMLLLRPFLPRLEVHFELVLLALGAFVPLQMAEAQGQDSVLSQFLCTAAFVCLVRGREFFAGAVLGLALYKPHLALPAILILVLASKERVRVFAGFSVACLSLVLLSIAVVGWKTALAYPRVLANVKAVDPTAMASVYGLLHAVSGALLSDGSVVLVVGALTAGVAASTAWILYRSQPITKLTYALLMTAVLLIAYHTHLHDLILLVLPLLVAVNWLIEVGLHNRTQRLIAACVAVLYALPMIYWYPPLYTCAILVFFAAFLWEACDGRNLLRPLQPQRKQARV
ncbi:glycosyltransferase family 87 protein [Edaphobacter bradus]|uniref:glycosyltransferase family 87 protein n=1 Tax=Edaphobacter bradus TaxID=2259016 RepID=UPI0021E0E522|nr:glycosyltransferase family 87 protein [Edaphobacter bradus]